MYGGSGDTFTRRRHRTCSLQLEVRGFVPLLFRVGGRWTSPTIIATIATPAMAMEEKEVEDWFKVDL
jgi:hypothetical protein